MAKRKKGDQTATRAITLPIAFAIERFQESDPEKGIKQGWVPLSNDELYESIRRSWRLSAQLMNWLSQRMFAVDDTLQTKPPEAVRTFEGYDAAMRCTRCGLKWSEDALKCIKRKAVMKCENCKEDWKEGTPITCSCANPKHVLKKAAIDKPANPQCRCEGEPTPTYSPYSEWAGAKLNFGQCIQTGKKKYLDDRFQAFIQLRRGRAVFSYPQPYSIHTDNWCVRMEECGREGPNGEKPGCRPVFEFSLPGTGKVRVALRHARHEFYRELEKLKLLLSGEATKRSAMVDESDNKNGFLVKMIVDLPKRERPAYATHACFLHTDPGALLVAEIDGRRPWIMNRDDLVTRTAFHRAYRQRLSEDTKREKRLTQNQRHNIGTARSKRCEKNERYMDTQVKQIAASVAKFWQRQGVGVVYYSDSVQEYMPDGFRWYKLKTLLQQHAQRLNIDWLDGVDYIQSAVTVNRPTPPDEREGSRGVYLSFPEAEREKWIAQCKLTAAESLAGTRHQAHTKRKGSHPKVSLPHRPPKSRSQKPRQ